MNRRTVLGTMSQGDPTTSAATQEPRGRRFFKLRAPWLLDMERSTEACVQVDSPHSPLVLKVGEDKPLSLPVDAGWALWRCLGEALASTGEPPLWALGEVQVTASGRRRWPSLRARRQVSVPVTTTAGGGHG